MHGLHRLLVRPGAKRKANRERPRPGTRPPRQRSDDGVTAVTRAERHAAEPPVDAFPRTIPCMMRRGRRTPNRRRSGGWQTGTRGGPHGEYSHLREASRRAVTPTPSDPSPVASSGWRRAPGPLPPNRHTPEPSRETGSAGRSGPHNLSPSGRTTMAATADGVGVPPAPAAPAPLSPAAPPRPPLRPERPCPEGSTPGSSGAPCRQVPCRSAAATPGIHPPHPGPYSHDQDLDPADHRSARGNTVALYEQRRTASTYSRNTSRNRRRFTSVRSISYSTPSNPNRTGSTPSGIGSPSRSSTRTPCSTITTKGTSRHIRPPHPTATVPRKYQSDVSVADRQPVLAKHRSESCNDSPCRRAPWTLGSFTPLGGEQS